MGMRTRGTAVVREESAAEGSGGAGAKAPLTRRGLTAEGDRDRVPICLSVRAGKGAGGAGRRRREARGRSTISAITAHQIAWRVAALTRGIHRSASHMTAATASASHSVFRTAVSPAAETAFRDSRIALIFHLPRGDFECSGVLVLRDRR